MKIMLLAGLYLFFVRVLWSVYNELRDPRSRPQRIPAQVPAAAPALQQQAPAPPPAPAAVGRPSADRGSRRTGRRAARAPVPAGAPRKATTDVADVVVGQLIVVAPPASAGMSYALGTELTVGRRSDCGIALDDGYVSQMHARIFMNGTDFFVEDLQSRNGTLLNSQRLVATTQLKPGDRISFGATVVEFS